ncbi:hypothetical protein MKK70_05840 [Methylobacterium sp. E-041]|uniref:hypothetical protein n=1 Tax=Methylobacterium sp. E-041 TaxID=2836573 RepID=UPI001FB89DD8|nr:hypothetical protein [Methylobacterium sp. E-041]MCJ2104908.1 hypothetical protein [Methylobacterium sp. E-041]
MLDTDEMIAASVMEGHNVVLATQTVVQSCKLLVANADQQLKEAAAVKLRTCALLVASLALLQRERR